MKSKEPSQDIDDILIDEESADFDADDIDVTKPTVANPNAFDELDDLLQ